MELKIRSTLVWLIMAGFCGLIGFTIIYHYASYERPMKHFAIVIDAGSTQTRSGLFTINIDTPELARWTNEVLEAAGDDELSGQPKTPLSKILQVRQVSSCVNGGPLATLANQASAQKVIQKCLAKFVDHIKRLDFIEQPASTTDNNSQTGEQLMVTSVDDNKADSEEVNKQMAMLNHRLNSVTHLYLGATAGMRSLDRIDHQSALEKITWINKAINESSLRLNLENGASPYINKGFIGIIKGSDEAAFGWLSVNFVCDQLIPLPGPTNGPACNKENLQIEHEKGAMADMSNLIYDTDTFQLRNIQTKLNDSSSVGILELGGASAQMAFRAPKDLSREQIVNSSLFEKELELFNGHYRLLTRSDLCLGMSQAVLRVNYILLRQLYSTISTLPTSQGQILDVENGCMQNGAELKLTGQQLNEIWGGACLLSSKQDLLAEQFKSQFKSNLIINFKGTGQVDKCNQILGNLIEPNKCNEYFSLCPTSKNKVTPPKHMPFVTISGYNHALNVLELTPKQAEIGGQDNNKWQEVGFIIEDKLGGNSIDFWELTNKTKEYCSTPNKMLLNKYSKVKKQFQPIICMQLIYIRKLLTEFYHFDPNEASWSQIKFLLFAPRSQALPTVAGKRLDVRRDIGWTLGLLLNATSEQLNGHERPGETIFFHHGASVLFVMRATIFMMIACCMLAVSLLVVGVIEVRRAQRRGAAYISQSSSLSSCCSYDLSGPLPPPATPTATTNTTAVDLYNGIHINAKPLRDVLAAD